MRRKCAFGLFALGMGLLLALLAPGPARAEDGTAKELTRSCQFFKNGNETPALYAHDQRLESVCPLSEGDVLRVQPRRNGETMSTLYLCLDRQEASLIMRQYDAEGTLLKESQPATLVYRLAVPLAEGCSRVELTGEAGPVGIADMSVWSEGALPDTLALPQPPTERTDFLIVTTHPDDEWIFLGAVYPIYGAERGYTGAFAYVTSPNIGRVHEAINSVWASGVPTLPYFLGFPDVDRAAPQRLKDTFEAEEVTLALVRLYRRIKPLVVVSQDPVHGEYGHWQHIISAQSALEAAQLASDPAFDPDSAAEYGVWTVRKVYQHLAEENPITLDVTSPLSAYGGETALQVAKRAFQEHRSQLKYVFRPSIGNNSKGDIRYFGLTYTTVGPDTENDMFEHLENEELAATILSAAPMQKSTPEPTPTEAPVR